MTGPRLILITNERNRQNDGMEAGMVLPAVVLEGYRDSIATHIVEVLTAAYQSAREGRTVRI